MSQCPTCAALERINALSDELVALLKEKIALKERMYEELLSLTDQWQQAAQQAQDTLEKLRVRP